MLLIPPVIPVHAPALLIAADLLITDSLTNPHCGQTLSYPTGSLLELHVRAILSFSMAW
jgi:hypothetical protein